MVTRTKKIFVGGLSAPSTLEDVKNYFEQFGRVSLGIFLIKITSNSVWTKSYLKVFLPNLNLSLPDWGRHVDVWQTNQQTQVNFTAWFDPKTDMFQILEMLQILTTCAGVLDLSHLKARTWSTKFARFTSMRSTIKWSVWSA